MNKYVQNADFFFLEKEIWEKLSRFCKIFFCFIVGLIPLMFDKGTDHLLT